MFFLILEKLLPGFLAQLWKSAAPNELDGVLDRLTPPENKEQYIEAWQFLIGTGYAGTLQGWFGRRAVELIEAGYCTK